ncbi:MAG: sigma-70 family RNA polymerase sigma factor [Bacteroidetes bacterium]|nr:sigma-70 family RNA polymerase sigma factor [Bacteroidota bacterium]
MLYSQVQDAELIERYASGDERAFEALMRRHGDAVFAAILGKVKDQDVADDLFQEVWIKFIHSVKSGDYAESGKFAAWIHRVARNATMDYFRRQQRSPLARFDHLESVGDGVADEALNVEERAVAQQWMLDAHEAVQRLPADQKLVLELRLHSGLSFKEIAEETGVGINTALGRMRYAVANLRRMLRVEIPN